MHNSTLKFPPSTTREPEPVDFMSDSEESSDGSHSSNSDVGPKTSHGSPAEGDSSDSSSEDDEPSRLTEEKVQEIWSAIQAECEHINVPHAQLDLWKEKLAPFTFMDVDPKGQLSHHAS